MSTATYRLLIDWDGDGSISEGDGFYFPWQMTLATGVPETEDVTHRVRASPGISTVRGKDQIRALSPPMAGRCDAELDNQDKELSIENTSSALYGNLLPGRLMQLQSKFGGTVYYLWTGYLDDLPQFPSRAKRTVGVPANGPLSKLAGQKISTALYSNITTDVALGHLLDAVGWASGDRVLDTGKTTLAWWWLENEDALEAARALVNTEGPGASLYEDGQGRIVFESRHYRLTTTRSNTSQATLRDGGTEPLFSDFHYVSGLKDIINVCEVTVKTRSAAGSYTAVWSLGETVTLAANESREYVATDTDPFTDAQTLAAGTDYTVTVGSLSSATLSRTSGQSTTITLTAGTSGATVTGLQLRAKTVTASNTTKVANTIDASSSITKYGRQIYSLSTRAEIAVNTAQDFVNAVVSRYQNARPVLMVTLKNGTDSRLTQSLSREVSDRVTVVEAHTGVNADYYVERIEHKIDEAGLQHATEFGCEKTDEADYAVWGTSLWGTGVWGF